jgi:REP element-mobilizing transposase RayT
MDEFESLRHTISECKYHLVFIPELRRKTLYSTPQPKNATAP